MRENLLTLLIRSPISQWVARSPILPLSIPHLSVHLCQGGLSGVVKLSIARKCSFIKADRRGGRLLKLITPRSHSKSQSFTVHHLQKIPYLQRGGDRECWGWNKNIRTLTGYRRTIKTRAAKFAVRETKIQTAHFWLRNHQSSTKSTERFVLMQLEMTRHPDTRLSSVFISN